MIIGTNVLVALLALTGIATGAKPPTQQTIANLRAFAKLYGYVRFFHPSDEASRIDQAKLAIYGAQRVWQVKDSAQLKAVLEELFRPIAPTLQIYHRGEQPKPVARPDDTTGMDVVAWQHHGLGKDNPLFTFHGFRSNRKDDVAAGYAVQMLPARPYLGRTVRLRAAAKAELAGRQSEARLGLWLDTSGYAPDIRHHRALAPVLSSNWETLEISMHVDSNVNRIYVGGRLLGTGKLWLDEFRLQYQDARGRWHDVKLAAPGFEGADAGVTDFRMYTEQWMRSGAGFIIDTTSTAVFKGQRSLLIRTDPGSRIPEYYPPAGAFRDKDLGCGLMCRLPIALYGDSAGTWGRSDSFPYARLDSALAALPGDALTADSIAVRFADVIIAWSVLQHFYPYFDVVKVDWDSALTGALQEASGDTSVTDFVFTLRRLTAQLKDGHATVWAAALGTYQSPPFWTDWIEGRLVVLAAPETTGLKPGDVIVSLDSVPAGDYIRSLEEFISGSPQWKRVVSAVWRAGQGKPGTLLNLEVRRGDSTFRRAVQRTPVRLEPREGQAEIRELKPGIWYVDLCRAQMAEIDKKMNTLARAKGVVFDLRGYPLDNFDVISHLLTIPDTSNKWQQIPVMVYPDQESIAGWDMSGWSLKPEQPHIAGRAVFLTNAWAMSAAEWFMSFIEGYHLAEIVGEPTAGADGIFNPFPLPGDITVIFTGMRVVKHDGSQHHLIGVLPTVPLTRTIKALREGRDEYIEKALEIIEAQH